MSKDLSRIFDRSLDVVMSFLRHLCDELPSTFVMSSFETSEVFGCFDCQKTPYHPNNLLFCFNSPVAPFSARVRCAAAALNSPSWEMISVASERASASRATS